MTKDLNELLPIVKEKAILLRDKCKEAGIDLAVTGTYRTFVEQDMLFLQPYDEIDNDKDGLIDEVDEKVTNAQAGKSLHNWRVAFDVVPVVDGVAVWNDNTLWSKIGQIGVDLGLEWGGNWSYFVDKPHFQYTLGYTWQDFKEGKVDLTKFNGSEVVPTPVSKEEIKKQIINLLNQL